MIYLALIGSVGHIIGREPEPELDDSVDRGSSFISQQKPELSVREPQVICFDIGSGFSVISDFDPEI